MHKAELVLLARGGQVTHPRLACSWVSVGPTLSLGCRGICPCTLGSKHGRGKELKGRAVPEGGGRGRTRTRAGNRCTIYKRARHETGKDVRPWKKDSLCFPRTKMRRLGASKAKQRWWIWSGGHDTCPFIICPFNIPACPTRLELKLASVTWQ